MQKKIPDLLSSTPYWKFIDCTYPVLVSTGETPAAGSAVSRKRLENTSTFTANLLLLGKNDLGGAALGEHSFAQADSSGTGLRASPGVTKEAQ